MSKRIFLTGLIAGSSFAGGLAANLLVQPQTQLFAQNPPLPMPPRSDYVSADALPTQARFEQVVRQVSPAVVAIDAIKPPAQTASSGTRAKPTEESGSGVLTRIDGQPGTFAITNNHVVTGSNAADIMVTLADGRIFRPDRVYADPESDIALLHLASDSLPVAVLGDSDQVKVGQWVLAIGSPFGLNQTVTHGIISARDRGQISLGNTIRIKEFLQTDAAINPGSSGGPLMDLDGEIIGINTAIASNNGNNSGVSFSVPINLAKRVARQLLNTGSVSRGYLGIQLAPTIQPSKALKLGRDRVWGALVDAVHPGGPAATGGLRSGDVIVRVDEVTIRDENHLINLVSSLPAGQRIRMTVWREKQWATADIVVGDWAPTPRTRAQ